MKKFPENFLRAVKDLYTGEPNDDDLNIDYAAAHFDENIKYFLHIPGYIRPDFVQIVIAYYKGDKPVEELCKQYHFTLGELDGLVLFVCKRIAAPSQIKHLFLGEKILACERERAEELVRLRETKRNELRKYVLELDCLAHDKTEESYVKLIDEFSFVDIDLTIGIYRSIMNKGIEKLSDLMPLTIEHLTKLGFTKIETMEILDKTAKFFSQK